MADDLDDLDGAEGGPPPPHGPRAGHRRPRARNHHAATMAHDRAAALAGVTRDSIYI
jgi:hypothetical protein